METSINLWENTERPCGDSAPSPERKRAMLLPYNKVSSSEADFDLREIRPLPRNLLHSCGVEDHGTTGQRANLNLGVPATGCRGWLVLPTSPKGSTANLLYSVDARDTAKSGIGHIDNRPLPYLAESSSVNVGGSRPNVKASSLPMSAESVGGVIVLGAWESRAHGEGRQEFDIPLYSLAASLGNPRRSGSTTSCERDRDDKAESDPSSGKSTSGEPVAGKLARRVRRGE